jgi:hypothetical protein
MGARDPGNAEWQRDLSLSYQRVGDLQMKQGDLAAALAFYSKQQGIPNAYLFNSVQIDALLRCRPGEVDKILTTALGCTVTYEEHESRTLFDRVCDGWERYRRAKMPVIDTLTRKLEVEAKS